MLSNALALELRHGHILFFGTRRSAPPFFSRAGPWSPSGHDRTCNGRFCICASPAMTGYRPSKRTWSFLQAEAASARVHIVFHTLSHAKRILERGKNKWSTSWQKWSCPRSHGTQCKLVIVLPSARDNSLWFKKNSLLYSCNCFSFLKHLNVARSYLSSFWSV